LGEGVSSGREVAGTGFTRSLVAWRPEAGAHVLVAQTSFLGDVVLTTPLLSALRRALRPRRLTVVVRPEAAPLLRHHPCVDALVIDDKRGVDRGPLGFARLVARLRDARPDVAVAPHKSLRTAAALAAAGIPRRVGFAQSRGAALYHLRVAREAGRHDVERNLALVEAFGEDIEQHLAPPHLAVGPDAEHRAEELLGASGAGGARWLYGVCPGSVWPTKRWDAAGFGALVRTLSAREHTVVLLLGADADRRVADAVQAHAGGAGVNLVGRTDLETFVAVVKRLRALVSNDSAPMHVATAVEVPVVAVFCATVPGQGYGPYAERAIVLGADLECRPCGRHGGQRCPRGTEDCMRLVDAAEVVCALQRLETGVREPGSALH
jgi:heptosyltransferase-2